MNDEQKAIDQLSIVMNLPKEEIARIIKRIQHAYRDEQERRYREMKQMSKGENDERARS